jgi:diadenosine tetraphosphate (Ap4A) HIT family hydrolase
MDCLFCAIADGYAPELAENESIDQSDNFYAKAALGHFLLGYTLVIPKDHYTNFSEVPTELFSELNAFLGRVRSHLQAVARKRVMIFEHGSINRALAAGACIDHAHFHLLPLSSLLERPLKSKFHFDRLHTRTDIVQYQKKKSQYLYFETPNERHYSAVVNDRLPRQFIRRVACDALGRGHLWDWRVSPLREKLEEFKALYKGVIRPSV